MAKKDIEYYMGLEYKTIVLEQQDGFFLRSPELGCIAHGGTLAKAYELLREEKRLYLQKMLEHGFEQDIPLPGDAQGQASPMTGTRRAVVITGAILAVIIVLGAVAGLFVETAVKKVSQAPIAKLILNNIQGAAFMLNEMPEVEREALRQSMRTIMGQLNPDGCGFGAEQPLSQPGQSNKVNNTGSPGGSIKQRGG